MSEVKYPARVRMWRQTVRWQKEHDAKGPFAKVYAGQVEELVLPVFIHPCCICGKADAPFGSKGLWYCGEHRPK